MNSMKRSREQDGERGRIRLSLVAVCVAVVVSQNGCGSVEGLSNSEGDSSFYIGVYRDLQHIAGEKHSGNSCLDLTGLARPFYVLDLPLSFSVDTVLLPFILFAELCCPPRPRENPEDLGK